MSLSFFRNTVLLLLTLLFCSCLTTRKSVVKVTPLKGKYRENLLQQIQSLNTAYHTLNMTGTLLYRDSTNSFSASFVLRSVRDSIIIISLRPLLGIETHRIAITRDSIIIIDRKNKKFTSIYPGKVNRELQEESIVTRLFDILTARFPESYFAYKYYVTDTFIVATNLPRAKFKNILTGKTPIPIDNSETYYIADDPLRIIRYNLTSSQTSLDVRYEYISDTATTVKIDKILLQIQEGQHKREMELQLTSLEINLPVDVSFSIPESYMRYEFNTDKSR